MFNIEPSWDLKPSHNDCYDFTGVKPAPLPPPIKPLPKSKVPPTFTPRPSRLASNHFPSLVPDEEGGTASDSRAPPSGSVHTASVHIQPAANTPSPPIDATNTSSIEEPFPPTPLPTPTPPLDNSASKQSKKGKSKASRKSKSTVPTIDQSPSISPVIPIPPSFDMASPAASSPDSTRDASRIPTPDIGSATVTTPEPDGPEFDLLDIDHALPQEVPHEVVTAPLITRDAYQSGDGLHKAIPQYGVIGTILEVHSNQAIEQFGDSRMYLNTNAPFSAVVCGVQGSGKSHTVSVLLESMMITGDARLGTLNKRLAGLVLHYGEGGPKPCEAAYQCMSSDARIDPPSVRIYASPTQTQTMKALYSRIFGNRVEVVPLKFAYSELDAASFLSMMCVSSTAEPPLYIQIILSMLRDMGENFNYADFKRALEEKKRRREFNPMQLTGLQQRMALLDSFLQPNLSSARFKKGRITIVDLTDPFIDPASACSIFEMVTRLFVKADVNTGKVLVLDEAHKYLTMSKGSSEFTHTLLSIVRQQRHMGMRMILSTQEPTVIPPVLLDLCSLTIMHRFSSANWFDHLSKHVSSEFSDDAFDAVVKLQTGQAIVLAPAGLGVFTKFGEPTSTKIENFGRRWLVMKTRRRVTKDGGASILVV